MCGVSESYLSCVSGTDLDSSRYRYTDAHTDAYTCYIYTYLIISTPPPPSAHSA